MLVRLCRHVVHKETRDLMAPSSKQKTSFGGFNRYYLDMSLLK